MYKKLLLLFTLISPFSLSIASDDDLDAYPLWGNIQLNDLQPHPYSSASNNTNNTNNTNNSDDSLINSLMHDNEREINLYRYNNEPLNTSSSSSSSSSSSKRILENSDEQNNEDSKKSKISPTGLVNLHPLNTTWDDQTKTFDFYFSENRRPYLPSYISLEIVSYLGHPQEIESALSNFKNSFKSVNGTKLINYLSMLHFYDKIQSIQEPYLPTRPHPLTDSSLLNSLCNPKILMHQSEKDKILSFHPHDNFDSKNKIYQTQDQKHSYYKTHYLMMKKLLEHGADASAYVQNKNTGLYWKYMITPLCFAATFNKENGGDLRGYHKPKYNATLQGFNHDLINLLLQYKANPNKKSYFFREDLKKQEDLQSTPLQYAVENNNEEAVQALLTHTSKKESLITKIDTKGRYGNTALHFAIQNNNPAIVQLLLDSNADTEVKNQRKETPLHLISDFPTGQWNLTSNATELDTSSNNKQQIVQLLLHAHANKDALDLHNKTPKNIVYQKLTQIDRNIIKYPAHNEFYQKEKALFQNIKDRLDAQP